MKEAQEKVFKYLREAEHSRMQRYVGTKEMFNPKFETRIDHTSRLAYMPCYIINYDTKIQSRDGSTFEKQTPVDLNDINNNKYERAIVDACTGSILAKREFSFVKGSSIFGSLSFIISSPICYFLLYPFEYGIATSLISSVIFPAMLKSRSNNSYQKLLGDKQNTSQQRYKHMLQTDREVADAINTANSAWGFTDKKKIITRRQKLKYETADKFYGFDKSGKYEESHSQFDYEAFDYTKAYGYDDTNKDDQSTSDKRKEEAYYEKLKPRIIKNEELYESLNISVNASFKEIQDSFAQLAKEYHPDKLENKSDQEKLEGTQRFQQILLAFQILKDPETRKEYDITGSTKIKKKKFKKNDTGTTAGMKQSEEPDVDDPKYTQKREKAGKATGTRRDHFSGGTHV